MIYWSKSFICRKHNPFYVLPAVKNSQGQNVFYGTKIHLSYNCNIMMLLNQMKIISSCQWRKTVPVHKGFKRMYRKISHLRLVCQIPSLFSRHFIINFTLNAKMCHFTHFDGESIVLLNEKCASKGHKTE